MEHNTYYKTILSKRSAWFSKRERVKQVKAMLLLLSLTVFTSYVTTNCVAFGVGFSNMYTYLKKPTQFKADTENRCEPPYSEIIIYLAPGFFAGCSVAETLVNPH